MVAAFAGAVLAMVAARYFPEGWRGVIVAIGFAVGTAGLKALAPQNAVVQRGSWVALAFAAVVVSTSIFVGSNPEMLGLTQVQAFIGIAVVSALILLIGVARRSKKPRDT